MIRLAHILSRVYPYAGTEKKVIQLLHSLDPAEFNSSLISMTDFWEDPDEYLHSDIQKFALHRSPGIQVNLILKISSWLKKNKIDILHSHNWATMFHAVLAAKMAGTPVIIHGEHGRETKYLDSGLLKSWVKKYLYNSCNKITVVTKDIKTSIEGRFDVNPDKIQIIHNGVTIPDENISAKSEIKKRYSIPENCKTILSIARMRPVKDIGTLIKAFNNVQTNVEDVHLLIVGAEDKFDPYRNEMVELTQKFEISNKISILEHTESLTEIYQLSDLYVNSSLTEGMSNTIMEAMANKLPVIASNVDGNPELVEHGKTGFLFTVQDHEDLTDTILKLLQNDQLRSELALNGFDFISKSFSFTNMIDQYKSLYHTQMKTLNEYKMKKTGLPS